MKIGVNLWTAFNWVPARAVEAEDIKRFASMGYQGVELVVDEAQNTVESLTSRRDAILAAAQECGISIPSIATILFWSYNPGSCDEKIRQKAAKVITDLCDVAEQFGAKSVLVVAGLQEPGEDYESTWVRSLQTILSVAPYAAERGITIAIENVPCNFLCSPGEYARYIKQADHPAVKAYLDIGNGMATLGGFPQNWIRAVRGCTAMVHVKDCKVGKDNAHGSTVCGMGDLDWETSIASLRACGYEGWLMVETPPQGDECGDDGFPAVGFRAAEIGATFLTRLLDKPVVGSRD